MFCVNIGGVVSVLLSDGEREGVETLGKGDIRTYNEDGLWKSKVEGSTRAAHAGGTKAEQSAVGRQMAQDRHVERTITNLDGQIGQENSYGDDPCPPKG